MPPNRTLVWLGMKVGAGKARRRPRASADPARYLDYRSGECDRLRCRSAINQTRCTPTQDAAQKYPSSVAARTPVWIQLGSGRYQFHSRSCRLGFGERQPVLRGRDLNLIAFAGDLYRRKGEFDAILVKRLLDHCQRQRPTSSEMAGSTLNGRLLSVAP